MVSYKMIYSINMRTTVYQFDGLYIIMYSPYRSLCTKFIMYAIILYGYQIVRRSFLRALPERCEFINMRFLGRPIRRVENNAANDRDAH